MSKQTAVEWLIQKLIGSGYLTQGPSNTVNGLKVKRIINQAKAMEKEQIEDAYQLGFEDGDSNVSIYFDKKEYYNQTYGGDK